MLRCDDRITKKGDMRSWQNARGAGTLFSVDLLDEDGSEIKGTFFKADADKWFEILQEGKVREQNRICRKPMGGTVVQGTWLVFSCSFSPNT